MGNINCPLFQFFMTAEQQFYRYIYFFTMCLNDINHIYECHLYISVHQTLQVVHYLDICLTEFSNKEGYERFPQKEKLWDKHTKERTLQQRAIFIWYREPALYTRKFYSKFSIHDMTLKTSVLWHIVQDNKMTFCYHHSFQIIFSTQTANEINIKCLQMSINNSKKYTYMYVTVSWLF